MSLYDKLTIGKYVDNDSLINRLDPRTKIISVIALSMAVFSLKNLRAFLVFAVFLLIVILLARLPLKFVIAGLAPISWIIFITFVFHLFFTGGKVILPVGYLKITDEGLHLALFVTLRLVFLMLAASVLTLTTSPGKLSMGLEYMLSPLKFVGIPSAKIALMMSLAMRFVPILFMEADRIMKAQKSRGAGFSRGSIALRVRSFVSVLVPLLAGAFRRAEELDTAMRSRGYDADKPRTSIYSMKWSACDLAAIIVTGGVAGLMVRM